MTLSRAVNPFARYELLAVPVAFLQKELAKFCFRFGLDTHTPAAGVHASCALLPFGFGDAERSENALLEQLEHGVSGHFLHDSREHVGAHGVVEEFFARLVFKVLSEPCFLPLGGDGTHVPVGNDARRHGEQVVNGHLCQAIADGVGEKFGEKRGNTVGHAQAIVVDAQPHSHTAKRFACAIQRVRVDCTEWSGVQLANHLAVAHHHHMVNLGLLQAHERGVELKHSLGFYALLGWIAARNSVGLRK